MPYLGWWSCGEGIALVQIVRLYRFRQCSISVGEVFAVVDVFVNLTVFVSFCMFVQSSVEASVSLSCVGFRAPRTGEYIQSNCEIP